MLNLSMGVRAFVCTRPTDMRRSFDGLMGMVSEFFGAEALSGHLFLFVNRRRDRLKILYWDNDGLAIWYNRHSAQLIDDFPPGGRARSSFDSVGFGIDGEQFEERARVVGKWVMKDT